MSGMRSAPRPAGSARAGADVVLIGLPVEGLASGASSAQGPAVAELGPARPLGRHVDRGQRAPGHDHRGRAGRPPGGRAVTVEPATDARCRPRAARPPLPPPTTGRAEIVPENGTERLAPPTEGRSS